jgi:hypothetical protein
MRRLPLMVVTLGLLAVFATRAAASILNCPAIVQTALEATQTLCSAAGRNQVCYGNVLVTAEPQPGVADFRFERQGDIVSVESLQSLRLSAMDLDQGMWGVSLMRLQANLPDTLPGQNVTFLVFGDVEMINRVAPAAHGMVSITATSTLNVRTSPTDASPTLTFMEPGNIAFANGRLPDNSWLRLSEPLANGIPGWVYAPLVQVDGVLDNVDVLDVNGNHAAPAPMQAFYLRTGVSGTACESVPSDGVLIQTPHDVGRIDFEVNGVRVNLGSTVFLQAAADSLSVSTIEGSAWVTANDQSQLALPGSTVTVPLDANFAPAAPPREAEPYDLNVISHLPVTMLERQVEVREPTPREQIRTTVGNVPPNENACGSPPLDPCGQSSLDNPQDNGNQNGNGNGNAGNVQRDNGNLNGNGFGRENNNQQNNGNQNGNGNGNAGNVQWNNGNLNGNSNGNG